MTSTDLAFADDDDEPGDRLARRRKRDRALKAAYSKGGLDVLEQFVPGILSAIERSQDLLPRIYDLIDDALDRKDTAALKDAAPMLKLLLDENKRLLDRRFGTSVQRSQNETTMKVQHLNLRGLMEQRKLAASAPATPPPSDPDEIIATAVEEIQ